MASISIEQTLRSIGLVVEPGAILERGYNTYTITKFYKGKKFYAYMDDIICGRAVWFEMSNKKFCASCGKDHGTDIYDKFGRCSETRNLTYDRYRKLFWTRFVQQRKLPW